MLVTIVKREVKHTVPAVFAIGNSGVSELLLDIDNLLDVLVLDSNELRLRKLALLEGSLGVQELISPEQRAKVLSTEGRVVVKRHDDFSSNGSV